MSFVENLLKADASMKKNATFQGIVERDQAKARILKKILDLSSIKPDTTKLLLRLLKGGKTAIKDKPKDEVPEVTFNPIESQEMDAATKGDRSEKGDKDKREDKADKPYDWKRDKKEVLTKTEVLLHTDASKFLDADSLEELKDLLDFQDLRRLENEYRRICSLPVEESLRAKHDFIERLRYTFNDFLAIIKIFILSPNEIKYINDIEKEIVKGEELDRKISDLTTSINAENEKKRDRKAKLEFSQTKGDKMSQASRTEKEKVGLDKESPEKLVQNISILENKLEKAHQKLNTTVSQNAQYREKINILRKEKNVIEDIYNKLKNELTHKKQAITDTIVKAGNAFVDRGQAEEELKNLQQQAQAQKKNFEEQCKTLNKSIEKEQKFKEFLMEKQDEKKQVEELQKQISELKEKIAEKNRSNEKLNKDYTQSAKKEQMIKEAFERITKETGIKECKELVEVFQSLNEKNERMDTYSKELKEELETIDKEIAVIKDEIAKYNTSGATKDVKKHELKVNLSQKIVLEEKKKQILKVQYEKSLETMRSIKSYLETLLDNLKVGSEKTKEMKEAAATEENLMQYFGILEDKGIEIVSEYARLIAAQIENEKKDSNDVEQQISNLSNIIQYENANILHSFLKDSGSQNKQGHNEEWFAAPDDSKHKEDRGEKPEDDIKWMSRKKFVEMASAVLDPKKDSKINTSQKQRQPSKQPKKK